MRLSTSSSSERIPQGSWGRTWLFAMLLVVAFVVCWDGYVRTSGLSTFAVSDSVELWIDQRERATTLGDDALVLVGASRIQGGLDLQVLEESTGIPPVQLAIAAAPFMPVLRHVANDPNVTGKVIVSMDMAALRISDEGTVAETWIRAYDDAKTGRATVFYEPVEKRLSRFVDDRLAAFNRNARPQQLIRFGKGRSYVTTLPDRSQRYDYSKVDVAAAYKRRVRLVGGGDDPRFVELEDSAAKFAEIESLVAKLRSRGADVVFVRFPSTKRVREVEDIMYPREVYWDRFVASTSAPTIHFADYPELGEFELPDGVHIDASEQADFTRALAAVLSETMGW